MTATVGALSLTPVKGTRLQRVEEIELRRTGAVGDRRFYLVDERLHMVNGKRLGRLSEIVAELPDRDTLRLIFPDGRAVEASVRDGETLATSFHSRPRADRLVDGPFADALSDHLEMPVQLVRALDPPAAVDRGLTGTVSLVSRASVAALAAHAAVDAVDARRFRMLVEVDGVPAHGEDGWVGARLRMGSAVVAAHGHVGRCLVTSRHPESGQVDLPTLEVLRGYRGEVTATEPLPFGIYGEVLEPGVVRVGDDVTIVT